MTHGGGISFGKLALTRVSPTYSAVVVVDGYVPSQPA